MKLFLKHLWKSILKRPLQPCVLVLTLALASAILISALSLEKTLSEEISGGVEHKYGSADIVVSLNSSSKSRFMFEKDAENVLSDMADVAGIYEIALSTKEGKTLFSAAPDFYTIGKIFELKFSEYREIIKEEIDRSVIVTKKFAEENSLSLGEKITLTVLGIEREYTVFAISPEPLIGQYELILDIRGVVKALESSSAMAAVMGSDFKPSSKMFINVKDGYTVEECIELLKTDSTFSEKSFSKTADSSYGIMYYTTLSVITKICVALTSILSAVMIFCCFYIISQKRTEENYSFHLAGAKNRDLWLMQYIEVFIYWIFGAPLGILLSLPLLSLFTRYAGFRFVNAKSDFNTILFASFLLLAVALFTVTLFRFFGKEKLFKKVNKSYIFVLLGLTFVLCISVFFFDGELGFSTGFAAMISLFMLLSSSAAVVFEKCAGYINSKREEKIKTSGRLPKGSFHYAVKNFIALRVLKNESRLISLLTAIIVGATVVVASANGNVRISENYFDSEYVVLNPTERCFERLKNSDSVSSVTRIYKSVALYENGMQMHIVSCEDLSLMGRWVRVRTEPSENGVIISTGAAEMLSVDVGDSIGVMLENEKVEMVVSDIIKSGVSTLIFDAEYFGISPNTLLLDINHDDSQAFDEVSRIANDELAVITKSEDLLGEFLNTMKICCRCAYALLYTVTLFAMIGLLDNLYESYRSRDAEFCLYMNSGMSKKGVRKMKICEVLISLVFGVLAGFIVALAVVIILDEALINYSYDMLYNFRAFFGG